MRARAPVSAVVLLLLCAGCARPAENSSAEALKSALSEAQLAGGQVCISTYDPEFAGLDGGSDVWSADLRRSAEYTRSGRTLTAWLKPRVCRTEVCQGIFVVFQTGDRNSFLFVEGDQLRGIIAGCFGAGEIEVSDELVLRVVARED